MTDGMKQVLEVLGEDDKRVLNNDQRKAVAAIVASMRHRTDNVEVKLLEAEKELAEKKLRKDLGVDKLQAERAALNEKLASVEAKMDETGFGRYRNTDSAKAKMQDEFDDKISLANSRFQDKFAFLSANIWLVKTVKELKELINNKL